MRRKFFFWGTLVLPAALFAALVWGGSIPLGVPEEWEWQRIEPAAGVMTALVPPVIFAAMLLGFVWLGAKRLERAGAVETGVWLGGLAVAGFGWLWVAQEAAPQGYGLSKAAWVLYYPGSSGYFTHARYRVADTRELLRGYEKMMSQGDVLHIGTHPPGLIVAYRGLMSVCRSFPRVAAAALETRPDTVRESFHVLALNARQSAQALNTEDEAVLWIAALAVQAVAAATVIPLFGLLRQCGTRRAAWIAASFWPAVPAVAIFLPKADAMYPFWAMLFLWLWHEGWRRRSPLFCCAAGIVLWMGLFMTLAFLPVVFFAAIRTWCEGLCPPLLAPREADADPSLPGTKPAAPRGNVALVAWAATAFFLPVLLLKLLGDSNLIATWQWNFKNHAAFYAQYHRTYWKWLLVNPLELAVAVGLPLAALAGWSIALRRECWNSRHRACAIAAAVTWGILLVSGKNMGEAARLWICFIPWLILVAAPLFERPSPAGDPATPPACHDRMWIAALALQFAFSLSLTACVVGFHPG